MYVLTPADDGKMFVSDGRQWQRKLDLKEEVETCKMKT